jgi:hypothetical protein
MAHNESVTTTLTTNARVEDVYCDELSDTAYAASNFRSDREWGTKVTL